MVAHHRGAIALAEAALRLGADPELRLLAESTVDARRDEVQVMSEVPGGQVRRTGLAERARRTDARPLWSDEGRALSPRRRARLAAAVVLAVAALAAGCGGGGGGGGSAAGDDDPVHVHGLGINPADGALYIATHTGLFRMERGAQRAERVSDRHQDTMGFTVVGPDLSSARGIRTCATTCRRCSG